jgi:hypothetical protein
MIRQEMLVTGSSNDVREAWAVWLFPEDRRTLTPSLAGSFNPVEFYSTPLTTRVGSQCFAIVSGKLKLSKSLGLKRMK